MYLALERAKKSVQRHKSILFSALHNAYRNANRCFLVKNNRFPANQREEMKRKAFKTPKVFSFLPYTETTEMLRGDFFGKKRQVPSKPT